MKKTFFTLSLFIAIFFLFENEISAQANNSSSNILRHIVVITFKPGASADSINALDNVYKELSKNSLVKDFESGVNISTRDTSLKHIYVTSFASKADMDNYRKIPEYGNLFKISLSISDDVTVADYWVKK